jgi:hypothetical protein
MAQKENNNPDSFIGNTSSKNNEASGADKKKCKPVSYEHTLFAQKPDDIGTEKRIDAHSLFSMFTANMIKKRIKWFR